MIMSDLGTYVNRIVNQPKGQQLFFGFIFIGLLIKIVLGGIAGATSLIWGYFVIIFSIIGLVFLRVDTTKNNMVALKLLFTPLLLLIIVLLWNISLNLRFFEEINNKRVPAQYYMWSRFSTLLITAIIVISILGYVSDDEKSFKFYNYILLVFNLVVTAVQQIVLESFTVDG